MSIVRVSSKAAELTRWCSALIWKCPAVSRRGEGRAGVRGRRRGAGQFPLAWFQSEATNVTLSVTELFSVGRSAVVIVVGSAVMTVSYDGEGEWSGS